MKTIKIDLPKGYEIDSLDKEKGILKIKESKSVCITEKIKTVDDVLKANHVSMHTIDYMFNRLPLSEHLKWQYIAELLAKTLNEGWKPDWNNSIQCKYVPWFEMAGSSGFRFGGCDCWDTDSAVGSRLCYKSSELAKYAGEQFSEVYRKFMCI